MKKIIFSALAICAAAFGTSAQTNLNIKLTSGETVSYPMADIDEITFSAQPTVTVPKAVSIAIPASFSSGSVQKVMVGDKQVAEICKEYVKATTKQMTVVYPCGDDGRAILTKGVTTTGASVVWDLAANTATVGTEGEELATLYLVDGEIVASTTEEATAGTVQPDIIVDKRGLETNTYKIVKIGTQYWMAENLRATRFADGSAIPAINAADGTTWNANTTGCYIATSASDADWVKMAGHLYNAFVMTNEKGIAPAGWAVPTADDFVKLKAAGSNKGTNFKSSTEMSWGTGFTGTNITGFNGIATGYYSSATGVNNVATEAYFWSSTSYYDTLSKSTVFDYMRLASSTTAQVSLSSVLKNGHSPQFGHSLRCIRL